VHGLNPLLAKNFAQCWRFSIARKENGAADSAAPLSDEILLRA
jgi:hypothetical protein